MTPRRPRSSNPPALEPTWDLPRSRHRLPREVVERHQRDRLILGVATALAERRYAAMTVEHVIEAASVSRATFYQNFTNKQEAVLAAHDVIFERFLGTLIRACNSQSEWPLKVNAAIGAALEFAAAEPAQAHLLTFDALSSNAEVARCVLDANDHLASMLTPGRQFNDRGAELPMLTEKALIGAITAIVASRLTTDQADTLPELQSQLVELTLTPYLGGEEAKRIAGSERPVLQ